MSFLLTAALARRIRLFPEFGRKRLKILKGGKKKSRPGPISRG